MNIYSLADCLMLFAQTGRTGKEILLGYDSKYGYYQGYD